MSALNYKKTSANKSGSLFALIDERLSERCRRSLLENGFSLIDVERSDKLSSPIASHPDMIFARIRDTLTVSREYAQTHKGVMNALQDSLPHIRIYFSDASPSQSYPNDRIYNVLVIGKYIFCKSEHIAPEIIRIANENGMTVCHTNQGYPACVTLGVGDGFAISSDMGMIETAKSLGIETLYIPESDKILLPPYKNGFIGGCAGVFRDKVYFIGNLDAHPSAKIIRQELLSRGYTAVSLDPSSDSLSDLGGILFFETNDGTTPSSGASIKPAIPKSE